MNPQLALLFVGAYLLGAIPFGVLIARACGVDITKVGSGNIGATNVLRAVGPKAAYPVMALDILKGILPPVVAKLMGLQTELALLVGFTAVLGHCASPFLRFRGGKGVATILGAAIGATPLVAAGGFATFALIFAIFRYVSLASIAGVCSAILFAYLLRYDALIVGAYGLLSFFIIYKHRLNIQRLLRGEEPKTSLKGGEKKQSARGEPKEQPAAVEEPVGGEPKSEDKEQPV